MLTGCLVSRRQRGGTDGGHDVGLRDFETNVDVLNNVKSMQQSC